MVYNNKRKSGLIVFVAIVAALFLLPSMLGLVVTGVSEVNFKFGDVTESAFLVSGVIKGGDSEVVVAKSNLGTIFEKVEISTKLTKFDCVYPLTNKRPLTYSRYGKLGIYIPFTEGGPRNECENTGGTFSKVRPGVLGFDLWGCKHEFGETISDIGIPFIEFDVDFTVSHDGVSQTKTVNHDTNRGHFYLNGVLFATVDNTRQPTNNRCGQDSSINTYLRGEEWILIEPNVVNEIESLQRTYDTCASQIGIDFTELKYTIENECNPTFNRGLLEIFSAKETSLERVEGNVFKRSEPEWLEQPPSYPEFSLMIRASEVSIETTAGKPELSYVSKSSEYVADKANPLTLSVINTGETPGSFQITGSCSPVGTFTPITTRVLAEGESYEFDLSLSAFCALDTTFSCDINALGGRFGGSDTLTVTNLHCEQSIVPGCPEGMERCSLDEKSIEVCKDNIFVSVKPCEGVGNKCFFNFTSDDYECLLTGGVGNGKPFDWNIVLIIGAALIALFVLTGKKGNGGGLPSFSSLGGGATFY